MEAIIINLSQKQICHTSFWYGTRRRQNTPLQKPSFVGYKQTGRLCNLSRGKFCQNNRYILINLKKKMINYLKYTYQSQELKDDRMQGPSKSHHQTFFLFLTCGGRQETSVIAGGTQQTLGIQQCCKSRIRAVMWSSTQKQI